MVCIIDLYQEEDMKMRTRKWSTLLAAVIAMTGVSSITLAETARSMQTLQEILAATSRESGS